MNTVSPEDAHITRRASDGLAKADAAMIPWTDRPLGSFSPCMQVAIFLGALVVAVACVVTAAIITTSGVQWIDPEWRAGAWIVVFPVVCWKLFR